MPRLIKVRPLTVVQLAIQLSDPKRFDMIETLRRTGWATNGCYLFRPARSVAKSIVQRGRAKKDYKVGRPLSIESIKSVLTIQTEPASCWVEKSEEVDGKVFYVLKSSISKGVKVYGDFLETLRKHNPNADIYLPVGEGQPVAFRFRGETVAAIMPTID